MPQGSSAKYDLTARTAVYFLSNILMKEIQKLSALLSLWMGEKVTPKQTLGVLGAIVGTVLIFASGSILCIALALSLLAVSTSAHVKREKGGTR